MIPLPSSIQDLIEQSIITAIWKRPELRRLREPIEAALHSNSFSDLLKDAFGKFAERSKDELPRFFDEGFLRTTGVVEHLSSYVVQGQPLDLDALADAYAKRHLDPSKAPDVRAHLDNYLRQLRETLAEHPTYGPILLARDIQAMSAALNNLRGEMHGRFDEVIARLDQLLKEPEIKALVERKTGAHIFLSYSRDNLAAALQIRNRLEDAGHVVWQDTTAIKGGAEWIRSIEDGIERAYAVVSVVSHESAQSEWVQIEFLHAKRRHKRILPIKIDDCEIPTMMLVINVHQAYPNFEAGMQALVTDLGAANPAEVPKPAADRRTIEIKYLDNLLLQFSVWQTVYTPMAGVGQLHVESDDPLGVVTTGAAIETLFSAFFDEQMKPQDVRPVERRDYGDILQAVADMRQLVILGDPGAGKTTTLWRITADAAEKAKRDPKEALPIFIRLGEFKQGDTVEGRLKSQLGDLASHYESLLEERRLSFLFDGLNELPDQGRVEVIRQIKTLVERCQQVDLVVAVTCRELDYTSALDLKIAERVVVQPLDPIRIRSFVNAYIQKPADAGDDLFWQVAGEDAHQQWERFVKAVGDDEQTFWLANELPKGKKWGFGSDDEYRDSYFKQWLRQRQMPRSLLTLASNPYMLYMITQVYTKERRIPQNRGKLFRTFVDFLLLKREHLEPAEANLLKDRLADLAYKMQAAGAGTSFSEADALHTLTDADNLYRARSANLLTGGDPVRFSHQLLQEYFAARRLDREMTAGTPASTFWKPENWWEANTWNETAILLGGLYSDDMTPVVEWLRDANPELTARCILESGVAVPDSIKTGLRPRWLPRLTAVGTSPDSSEPPGARAAVGRALGSLNLDDRPGVAQIVKGAPVIVWCEVPKGDFTFGEGGEAQQISIPYPYWIAKYPVSYAQFAAFVEAGGYTDKYRHCWTDAGWEWKKEALDPTAYWQDPQWHIANHPVVGVTWYEAFAFCQWLNEVTTDRPDLALVIRLPTEAEWEKAVRYPDGRQYPWGNDYLSGYANIDETGNKVGSHYLQRTSPVGMYPQGAHPVHGAHDLSGSVWEWCQTKWAEAYQHPGDHDPAGDARRCLRGGSWSVDLDYARASFRNWNFPNNWGYNRGFRVVLSYPIF